MAHLHLMKWYLHTACLTYFWRFYSSLFHDDMKLILLVMLVMTKTHLNVWWLG